MRPGPQAAEEAGKEQLSLRPLTARPGWGGLPGLGLLCRPSRDPQSEPAQRPAPTRGGGGREGAPFSPQPRQMLERRTIGETRRDKRGIRHDRSQSPRSRGPRGEARWEGGWKVGDRDAEEFRILGTHSLSRRPVAVRGWVGDEGRNLALRLQRPVQKRGEAIKRKS